MKNTEQRICIIGGGPAGTSAAMYLEKAGYYNYVIYEKTDRVGGKAFSPLMKVKNSEGKWEDRTIEMGAVMGCDTYFAVQECEEFGGATHADGPAMGRRFMKVDGTPQGDQYNSSQAAVFALQPSDGKEVLSNLRFIKVDGYLETMNMNVTDVKAGKNLTLYLLPLHRRINLLPYHHRRKLLLHHPS